MLYFHQKLGSYYIPVKQHPQKIQSQNDYVKFVNDYLEIFWFREKPPNIAWPSLSVTSSGILGKVFN